MGDSLPTTPLSYFKERVAWMFGIKNKI